MRTARFASTLFLSATLLFACQPMVARMLVPLLGGAPSVWIVCSLVFQALLLAGYCYSHFVGTRLPVRAQVALQLALIAAALLSLPIAARESSGPWMDAHPTAGLIVLLLRTVGLPFFVLSTTSPLVQRWFAEMGEEDPYYLYVASNMGSMIALLGYPFVVEPHLALRAQSRIVHFGYALYALLVVVCAATTLRTRRPLRVEATPAPPGVSPRRGSASSAPRSDPPPSISNEPERRGVQRLGWIALAFAPSSLLLGATEYVTTHVASAPLLWVVPLALYLGSFIVAFSKRPVVSPAAASRALAVAAAVVAVMMLADVQRPAPVVVGAHLLLLFVASVACHQQIAARRPPVARLTEFYLLMSVGGVLGAIFNVIVAPFVFDDLTEYPIAIGLVCLARLSPRGGSAFADEEGAREATAGSRRLDVALGLALGVATLIAVKVGAALRADPDLSLLWIFGPPLALALAWARRPIRYAVALAAILVAALSYGGAAGQVKWRARNFFGVLKVARSVSGRYRMLVYGNTMQGQQALDPAAQRVPLAYYHPTGPAGDVLDAARREGRRVGVIGLGIGSLAAYARPGDAWTFFEINPAVVTVARTQFTYLDGVPAGARLDFEVGDARLRLREGAPARFDVLVLDALGSDAVPVHLVTREAIEIYRRALAVDGVLLVNVSNPHVALHPVLGALARDAGLGALARRDVALTAELREAGKTASEWVLLAASADGARRIVRESQGWRPLEAPPDQPVWTDDFANVLGAMRF